MEKFDLAPAEWNIMECLWELAAGLRRMVGKGVVTCDTEGTKNTFSPAVRREDAALAETETFLDRVYQGSLSMMVSAMTRRQAISKEEIDELYELLRQMEEGTK